MAGEFAERYPKIAGRLRLTKDTVDDPHVSRLLEGVAFLGARVQHRLDDEFPELTDALLSVLYPHYLAPMPSVGALDLQDLQRALSTLAPEQREVVLLVALEDMSYADVSRALGIPMGTVMSRLSRGRERLRRVMNENGPKAGLKVVT